MNKDYKRFLLIARGSLEEIKYQILLAKDLKYIKVEQYESLNIKTNKPTVLLFFNSFHSFRGIIYIKYIY